MNIYLVNIILFFTVCYTPFYAQSVEEEGVSKFRFAIDIGAYLPNNKPAQFLDGSHPFGVTRILNQPQLRQQIEQQLGYPIQNWEFSRDNRYNPTVYAGLYMGYDIKPSLSVVMKVNFSVLNFTTPFVIQLNNPQNFTGEFEQATVTAREQRFRYELGIQKSYAVIEKLNYSIMVGGCLDYIQLENQELIIRQARYNITRVQTAQALALRQIDGFGFGGVFETGFTYELNEKFSAGLFLQASLIQNRQYVEEMTLNTNYLNQSIEEASGFLPSFGTCFRLIWN